MLKMIVCVDEKGAIGNKGKLLTHNPEDLAYFKRVTEDKVVIMGNTTYHSLPMFPKGLTNRVNVVFTSNVENVYNSEYAEVIDAWEGEFPKFNQSLFFKSDVKNFLKECVISDQEAWCIGGASIYEQCKEFVQEVHVSVMNKTFKADTFLNLDFLEEFTLDDVISLNNYTDVEIYKRGD